MHLPLPDVYVPKFLKSIGGNCAAFQKVTRPP